jgi:hypothetical protein
MKKDYSYLDGKKNQTKNNSKRIMWKKNSYLVRIGMEMQQRD